MKLNDSQVGLEFRVAEAKRLGNGLASPATLTALLEGLDVKSEVLRDAIRAALDKLKAGPSLVAHACDSSKPQAARLLALHGLRTLKPGDAAVSLASLLGDPDAKVRAAVAQLYCVFGAAQVEAPLTKALSDADAAVRYFVVVATSTLPGARGALEALKATEQDPVVQDALAQALRAR